MALPGRKPPAEGEARRNPHRKLAEWTEVDDVPFDGPWPDLPAERTIITRDGQISVKLQGLTVKWWDTIKRMPHAKLWTDSDWMFAVETALVVDAAFCGVASAQTESRNRQKVLGTTSDFRRDLRIKYVPAGVEREELAEVRSIDSVRDL